MRRKKATEGWYRIIGMIPDEDPLYDRGRYPRLQEALGIAQAHNRMRESHFAEIWWVFNPSGKCLNTELPPLACGKPVRYFAPAILRRTTG